MKATTKLWYGLGETVARAGAAAVAGTALLPAAFAGPAGEAGEGGEGAQPAAQGKPAGEGGESGYSVFPGNIDKAVSNIFAGEGGEGGAGLSLMWPSITIPALSSADIKKVVSGNTLRTDGHVAWYFTPDRAHRRRVRGVEGDRAAVVSSERDCDGRVLSRDRRHLLHLQTV